MPFIRRIFCNYPIGTLHKQKINYIIYSHSSPPALKSRSASIEMACGALPTSRQLRTTHNRNMLTSFDKTFNDTTWLIKDKMKRFIRQNA